MVYANEGKVTFQPAYSGKSIQYVLSDFPVLILFVLVAYIFTKTELSGAGSIQLPRSVV